jgi:lipoprotein NlpD
MRSPACAPCAVVLALVAASCGPQTAPPTRLLGVWHEVAPGETAAAIAGTYGADPGAVAELNDVPRNGAITNRREVFVPTEKGGKVPGTGATPIAPKPPGEPEAKADTTGDGAAQSGCDPKSGRCLEWPARGEVVSRFGARGDAQHDGIDIVAPRGTAVVAAEAGRVVYSGDGIKGYGNMILIRHEGGLITVYAHNDVNEVKDGETVERGQKIAAIGQSGTATASHLHFEVREGENPSDPLRYLPRQENGR